MLIMEGLAAIIYHTRKAQLCMVKGRHTEVALSRMRRFKFFTIKGGAHLSMTQQLGQLTSHEEIEIC